MIFIPTISTLLLSIPKSSIFMIKKLLFCLLLSHVLVAQTDFQNLKWEFRGPTNVLEQSYVKRIFDISHDPNTPKKMWACTDTDGLVFNENIFDKTSKWQRSNLPIKQVKKICFSLTNPKIMLAISPYRLWRSNDGGNNWFEIIKQQPHEYRSTYQFVWITRKGRIVVASNTEIFVSEDDGKTFRIIYESPDKFHGFYDVSRLWIQENDRLYVRVGGSAEGRYSDDYYTWTNISTSQMAKEEFPAWGYDQFHGYIVADGTQLHGFTTNRKNIIDFSRRRYSVDGGATYRYYPESWLAGSGWNEFTFINDYLVFVNEKHLYILRENSSIEMLDFGILSNDFEEIEVRDNAGDNYFLVQSSNFRFNMNNVGVNIDNQIKTNNLNFSSATMPQQILINDYNSASFTYHGARKFYKTSPQTAIIIKENQQLALAINTGIYGYETKLTDLTPVNTFVSDFIKHPNSENVYFITDNGIFSAVLLSSKFSVSEIYKFENPFFESQFAGDSENPNSFFLTDKKSNIWFTSNAGKGWQKINLDKITDLKINKIHFLSKTQTLIIGTENGVFFVQDYLSPSPKIYQYLLNTIISDIKFREKDEYLVVLTKYSGIYTTNIFSKPNQLITKGIDYFNFTPDSPIEEYETHQEQFLRLRNLVPTVCNTKSIRVHFATNIPDDPKQAYQVELLDENDKSLGLLEGNVSKSPIEAKFSVPQNSITSKYKVRVIATGKTQLQGTESILFQVREPSKYPVIIPSMGYSFAPNVCVVDSFKIFTPSNPKFRYQWSKDGEALPNSFSEQIYVKDKNKYRVELIHDSGCIVGENTMRLITCPTTTDNKAILLNPPKITTEKTSYYSTEKAILKVDGCENVNYQWLKDDLPIKDATNSTYEVKESGNYKLKIEKFGCENRSKELSIQIINVLANEELDNLLEINVFPNPSADKISIYSKEVFMKTTEILLHDLNGKELKRLNFTNFTNTEMDLNDFQQGSYLLSVISNDKKIVKKILIQ